MYPVFVVFILIRVSPLSISILVLVYCDVVYINLINAVIGMVGCGLGESGWGLFVMWLCAGASYVHWDVGACIVILSDVM